MTTIETLIELQTDIKIFKLRLECWQRLRGEKANMTEYQVREADKNLHYVGCMIEQAASIVINEEMRGTVKV